MRKLLIGPVLVAALCLGGAYYGADAEQLVHKPPAQVYAALDAAIGNMRQSGTTHFDGGQPMAYALDVARTANQRLTVDLSFAGQPGARAELLFTPANGGADTLIVARFHGERAGLAPALAGTDKARLAYAPDWILNLSARPLLQQLASQIEHGEAVGGTMPGLPSQAEWEAKLSPDEREQVAAWQQYQASQPTVDPDAAARNYMGGEGAPAE